MRIEKGKPDVRADLFGGRGEVRVSSLLPGQTEPFTALLSCELAPGGTVGPHFQEHFPELILGLEGRGAATMNDAEHTLCPGDAVYLPLGSVLSIRNCSDAEPLRYLIIKARG